MYRQKRSIKQISKGELQMNIEDAENSETPTVQQMDAYLDSNLENEYYYCSWEWHIARLSPVCSLIYPYAFRVSGGMNTQLADRRFFGSAKSLATYFDYSESQVRRGLLELEEIGFFQLIARKKFKPTHFRVLSHDDWAAKQKGKCTTKREFPWTGEGDSLGRSLWKMSGGHVRFADFQVKGLRKLGVDESKVVAQFSAYWEQTGQKMKPKNVPANFYMHMKNSGCATQQCSTVQ
jgi:hypothetical protein